MRRGASSLALALSLALAAPAGSALGAGSLRFHGNGVDQIDRVKIRIDDLDPGIGGPPADVGATDVTFELWLRCLPGSNPAPPVSCGANVNWIYGHVILDRDRYNQDRKFGLSLVDGRAIFGVSGDGTGDRTICGTTDLRDGAWHHLAVQRRRSDGHLWLHVDGVLEASGDGPDGDISYPDDGLPGNHCGGPCVESDPFLVLAAEKHDAGPEYPSFDGWLDEFRISTTLRYPAPFLPPTTPYVPDAATAALYHLDEGAGNTINDSAAGGASPGERRFGGSPAGPEWSTDTPFGGASGAAEGPGRDDDRGRWSAAPNPFHGTTTLTLPAGFRGDVDLFDVLGRRVARLPGVSTPATDAVRVWDGRGADGRPLPPGLYFARAVPAGAEGMVAPRPLRLVRR